MGTPDVVVQRWIADVLAVLQDRETTKQKPSTILASLKKQAITGKLKRDLAEHLTAAGISCEPAPANWSSTTPWVVFSRPAPSSAFLLTFATEKELSEFIEANWQRIPFLAGFLSCKSQHRLQDGRLICDLLLTRRRGEGVVVVELKKGKPGLEAVSELFGYVEALKAEEPERPVEAWLVTGRPNEALVDDLEALSAKHDVKTRWFTYGVSFELNALR